MENTQVPNGGMLMVTAPSTAPQQVASQGEDKKDPRIWRPKVTKKNTSYEALLRALPRGRDLNAFPYVCVTVHRIRDFNSGHSMTVKCCKNIPGVRNCPFCEDVWARYNAAKEQPGATKDSLKKFLQQLPDEEWYGNFLIRQDANHPEYNGQVKVWPHSKYQHAAFQEPVDKFVQKQNDAARGVTNGIQADAGDAFIPYDPVNGYDYILKGAWDATKTFGNGKMGAPTYKGSTFVKNPSPLAAQTVIDPATNLPTAVVDENSIYALLDQCYDLNFVFEDIPTPQQAVAMITQFWKEANEVAQQKAMSGAHAGFGYQQPAQQAMPAAPALNAPAFATQPFQTGAVPMGGAQNSIPQVPANAKISTSTNPAAFMGQAPAVGQVLPTNGPAPMPAPAAPATPAFAAAPIPMQAPAAPVAPQPQVMPGSVPFQGGIAGATYGGAVPVAPAAPAAPVQQAYVPPAAPPIAPQPAVSMPPAAGPTPIVETDSEDDLPF